MNRACLTTVMALLATLAVATTVTFAQRQEPLPEQLEEVGVTEHLDERIPLELEFRDESGKAVTLGDYFEEGRPVVMTLGYYRCRVLCNLVVHGVLDTIEDVDWKPGDEFEIVTVSIDPDETPQLATDKKAEYLSGFGREAVAEGWHFLTGQEEQIRELADAVGFHYRKVEQTGEFAHPAVLFVVMPDGRISRYLYGVKHDPKTVRLSLVEASEGRFGSTMDKVILSCFYYDPEAGSYVPAAIKIMRLGGGIVLVVVVLFLALYWTREARRKKKLA